MLLLRTLAPSAAAAIELTLFNGHCLSLVMHDDGVAELCFDRQGEPINKFDQLTTDELRVAVGLLAASPGLRGVVVTSAKDSFIVGADIGEFEHRFRASEHELARSLWQSNEVFMAFEDLPVPSVAAINGHALGGGCEMALTAAFRVMARGAKVGVPEVSLGLFPGLGGTVRLPRVCGPAVAIDWIANGASHSASAALEVGMVDELCSLGEFREAAFALLRRAVSGTADWRTRQAAKRTFVPMPRAAHGDLFARAVVECASMPDAAHQPAAAMAIGLMARTTLMARDAAQWQECEAFATVARTQAARARVQAFLDERAVNRIARSWTKRAPAPLQVSVHPGFDASDWSHAASDIVPVASMEADLVLVDGNVDAQRLIGSIETARAHAPDHANIACVTTSSAQTTSGSVVPAAKNVVGLHVRDRVAGRRLAEVLRGPSSGEAAIACAVAWAAAMKCTPIVTSAEEGGLVERMLACWRAAWRALVSEGISSDRLHETLLRYGWERDPLSLVLCVDAAAPSGDSSTTAEAGGIVERLMLPLVVWAASELEAGRIGSAAELDTAIRVATGMPSHLGGPLQYADWLGLAQVVERLGAPTARNALPLPTPSMREMARAGQRYHQKGSNP